jgi:hypothetical protein
MPTAHIGMIISIGIDISVGVGYVSYGADLL